MTADLIAFLRARLDEDYEAARLVLGTSVMAGLKRGKPAPRWALHGDGSICDASDDATLRVKFTWRREADHIARHDPARVLREVEAKREIIDDLLAEPHAMVRPGGSTAIYCAADSGLDDSCECDRDARVERRLRLLALPDDDHPDYREEWRP